MYKEWNELIVCGKTIAACISFEYISFMKAIYLLKVNILHLELMANGGLLNCQIQTS